ncbi:MAG: DUF1629 domain-containing protein [Stappiaceae bacterium]
MPFCVHSSSVPRYSPRVACDPEALALLNKQVIEHDGMLIMGYKQAGLSVDPDAAPKTAQVLSAHKKLFDIVPANYRLLVTRPFIEKVEELEPGVHQFLPIEVRMKSGELAERDYWILNICNRTNAIDPDNSVLSNTGDTYFTHGIGPGATPKLVFNKARIDSMCMWIDQHYSMGEFFSDELMQFIESEKLKDLEKWKVFAE